MERRIAIRRRAKATDRRVFDQFTARPISPEGRLADGRSREADEVENYFRGRMWPDLINYFQRWDVSLSSVSFLTDTGFALTLPAFLVASLLWPDKLDTGILMSTLLAPECKREPRSEDFDGFSGLSPEAEARVDERRKRRFAELHRPLTQRQRIVVGRALKYLVHYDAVLGDASPFESYTGLPKVDVLASI